MEYYLGREFYDNGMIKESLAQLERYTKISVWDEEKAMACLKLSQIYTDRLDNENGIKWAFEAIKTREDWGEGYFALGRIYYYKALKENTPRAWEKAANFFKLGLSFPPTKTPLFLNPNERGLDVPVHLNYALFNAGKTEEALKLVLTTLEKYPKNKMLLQNKAHFESVLWVKITPN